MLQPVSKYHQLTLRCTLTKLNSNTQLIKSIVKCILYTQYNIYTYMLYSSVNTHSVSGVTSPEVSKVSQLVACHVT